MKVLIVDDEPPARARLRSLVGEIAGVKCVAEASNGTQALRLVERLAPDVLLLDIRMPGMDGLEVARHLARFEQPPSVIFTTAFDSHALAAFEAQALDYLLKPIRRQRLETALARARRLTHHRLDAFMQAQGGALARTHLSATLRGNLELVPVEAIRFLRAEHKYVTAGHPGGALLVDDALAALERELGNRFLRVHRNALVALEHVRGLERDASGRLCVSFDGVGDRVEVSRRFASRVRKRLERIGGRRGDGTRRGDRA